MQFVKNIKIMNQVVKEHCVQSNTGELVSMPTNLALMPSVRCNYDCIFCSQDHDSKIEYSEKMIQDILELLPFADSVNINGGEPLLYPKLDTLLEAAGKNECNIIMVTNGSLMTEQKRKLIIASGVSQLKVSFDGATPEVYNKVRRNGDFHNVVKKIKALSDLKAKVGATWPRITFNFVALQDNIEDLSKLVVLANSIGVEHIDVQYCRCDSLEVARKSLFFTQDLSDEKIIMASGMAKELGVGFFSPALFKDEFTVDSDSRGMCRQPFEIMSIGPTGNISMCCSETKSYGNIVEDGIMGTWNHPARIEVRQRLNTPNEMPICKRCSFGGKQDPRLIRSHIPNKDIASQVLAEYAT